MVNGLDIFRGHFHGYADRYVLIGGTACEIAMASAGLSFRATKDLDIVLFVEALDAVFVWAFWAFVLAGGYIFDFGGKLEGQQQCDEDQDPGGVEEVPVDQAVADAGVIVAGIDTVAGLDVDDAQGDQAAQNVNSMHDGEEIKCGEHGLFFINQGVSHAHATDG